MPYINARYMQLRGHIGLIRKWIVLIAFTCLSMTRGADKVELTATEWQAVTLAKMLPYIKWPDKEPATASPDFVVGVWGADPVAALLEGLVAQTKVLGRNVKVRTLDPTKPLEDVQMLFIPESGAGDWAELSRKLEQSRTLAVGVTTDFTRNGGVIGLRPRERQLVVNLENARKANVSFDSKLLRICIKEK